MDILDNIEKSQSVSEQLARENKLAQEFAVERTTMELAVKLAFKKVNEMRVLSTSSYVEEPQLLRIVDDGGVAREVLSLGDISMVQGAAKSRKSTFTEMIARYLLTGDIYGNCKITSDIEGAKILYIDTEQSVKHTTRQFARITYGMGDNEIEERFFYLPTVDVSNVERKALLRVAIEQFRPTLVIIDGVVDLCANFLDNEESQELIMLLKRWAKQFNCHILSILHTNPDPKGAGTKARGHLGTMMEQKCQTVISVTKKEDEVNGTKVKYSEVAPVATRDIEFSPFNITRDEHGNPIVVNYIQKSVDEMFNTLADSIREKGGKVDAINLNAMIMKIFSIKERKAYNYRKQFVDNGWLLEIADGKEKHYTLNTQEEEFEF